MKRKSDNSGVSIVVILLFIAVVLGASFYFVWKSITPPASVDTTNQTADLPKDIKVTDITKSATAKPKATPTPTPIPLRPDDGVKGTYQVGMGQHEGPTVTQVVFDPLDVKKGQTLNLTVKANDTAGVSTLTGVLTTDRGSVNIELSLKSGSAADGVWSGSASLNDTVDYKYILTLTAKSSNGKTSTVTVAPRS